MAEIDYTDKTTFRSTLACFNGLWQPEGMTVPTPPAGSGFYTSFYFNAEGKVYYGFDGQEHELRTGADVRFPTYQPEWPPVPSDDTIDGDFWVGPRGTDPIAIQHAIQYDDDSLAYLAGQTVPYEGGDGNTLNAPAISSAQYQEGTGIVLNFSLNNATLSRVVLYKIIGSGAAVPQDLSLLATSYTDTAYTPGLDYKYYLVVYSGTLVSPQSNTVTVQVPVNNLILQFTVISPPGYANTIIKALIQNPSNTNEPIKYNWAVYLGDYFAGGIYKASGFDSLGSEPGVGVLVLDLSRYDLIPGVVYRLYLQESNDPTADKRRNWVEFTLPEPNTVPAETDFVSGARVSGTIATGDLKISIRSESKKKPQKFELMNLSGTVVETRNASNRSEELFTQNLTGFRWRITDADNKVSEGRIDAVSFKAYVTPVRSVTSLLGQPSEQVANFDSWGTSPGMNAVGCTFNAFEFMQERLPISEATRQARFNARPDERARWDNYTTAPWQGFDNPLWDSEYDHTVAPTSGYTHPFDEVVRKSYLYVAADPTKRLGMKLGFWANRAACTCSDRYAEYSGFTYSTNEAQKDINGSSHVPASLENQYLKLLSASYASDDGRLYWAACLKKFCKRYRQAILDGTINTISFCMNLGGEEAPAGQYWVGSEERYGYGDFSVVMRAKFAAWLSMGFGGNVSTFNTSFQMGSRAITAFTASQLTPDLLNTGPKLLQNQFSWFQMLQMAEFTAYIRNEVYDNIDLSERERLWTVDVGAYLDNLMFVNKSADFVRRLSIQKHILYAKANNNPEGSNNDWPVAQITSVARVAGAVGVWEVSPQDVTWTNFVEGVKDAMAAGLGLSCFPANGGGISPIQGWVNIAAAAQTDAGVKMATYTKYPEVSTVDASGNPRRAVVNLKDFGLYLKPDPDGVIRPIWPVPITHPQPAWQALVTASGGLPCEIYVDSSSMFSDLPSLT